MACNPADIGGAPENILIVQVEIQLCGPVGLSHVAPGVVDYPLGPACCSRSVKQEECVLAVHLLGVAAGARLFHQLVPPQVPSLFPGNLNSKPFHNNNIPNARALCANIGILLKVQGLAPPIVAVCCYQDLCFRVNQALLQI